LIDVKSLPRTFRAAIDAHQGGASCTPYDPIETGVAGTERELPPLHHGIASGAQKVAVAIGFTNILWPTKVATGKILILGLPRA
jgi:hypothetical protein